MNSRYQDWGARPPSISNLALSPGSRLHLEWCTVRVLGSDCWPFRSEARSGPSSVLNLCVQTCVRDKAWQTSLGSFPCTLLTRPSFSARTGGVGRNHNRKHSQKSRKTDQQESNIYSIRAWHGQETAVTVSADAIELWYVITFFWSCFEFSLVPRPLSEKSIRGLVTLYCHVPKEFNQSCIHVLMLIYMIKIEGVYTGDLFISKY